MTEREPDIVTVNGRQIDFIEIHEDGPLVPLILSRSQGGGVIQLGGSGQKIRLSINPGSSDWQWLDSISRQRRYSLDFESACIATLRKKIGKRGSIVGNTHDTWYLEFPDWDTSQ
ncbi:hypothetical protein ACK36B_15620 [Aeromonas veronii]|uniref:Uncharacterized protein n=1 Tax=Aeromonas veronii TaxID=654 RepID=A0AAW5M6B9_AERVE|nr:MULTISPECIES: hypothetical protein [Aeromonas]KRV83698.1 hypothetical protein AO718_18965 [Aeromonas veronii]KRW03650.1 hypothetical protein AO725_11520 [Aeromonas veronii]KRW08917.1 hypothetical protein AO745_19835 [Aeromonas veronii]KRW13122.1 hypothetical protein AO732_17760 [Aeromonas veronii]KRW17772.1 hypothetical protein AO722_20290 [Aeromonas veronii]